MTIDQSRYVNVMPRRRIDRSLQRMRMADKTRVDESIGGEIAEREGVQLLLVPQIADPDYAVDCKDVQLRIVVLKARRAPEFLSVFQ